MSENNLYQILHEKKDELVKKWTGGEYVDFVQNSNIKNKAITDELYPEYESIQEKRIGDWGDVLKDYLTKVWNHQRDNSKIISDKADLIEKNYGFMAGDWMKASGEVFSDTVYNSLDSIRSKINPYGNKGFEAKKKLMTGYRDRIFAAKDRKYAAVE